MFSLIHFLGKPECMAFLRDCMPEVNRNSRRAAVGIRRTVDRGDLRWWASLNTSMMSAVAELLIEAGEDAKMLDSNGEWLEAPTEARFRAWTRSIAAKLEIDPARVALAIAASFEQAASSTDANGAAAELARGGLRSPVPPVTFAASPSPETHEEQARESVVDPDEGERAPFGDWLEQVARLPPEWLGWDRAFDFAERLRDLATSKLGERSQARRRLEELLGTLSGYQIELEYLQRTDWAAWQPPGSNSLVPKALIERVETLLAGLGRLAELRAWSPRSFPEEQRRLREIESALSDLAPLYDAIEVEFSRGHLSREGEENGAPPPSRPPRPDDDANHALSADPSSAIFPLGEGDVSTEGEPAAESVAGRAARAHALPEIGAPPEEAERPIPAVETEPEELAAEVGAPPEEAERPIPAVETEPEESAALSPADVAEPPATAEVPADQDAAEPMAAEVPENDSVGAPHITDAQPGEVQPPKVEADTQVAGAPPAPEEAKPPGAEVPANEDEEAEPPGAEVPANEDEAEPPAVAGAPPALEEAEPPGAEVPANEDEAEPPAVAVTQPAEAEATPQDTVAHPADDEPATPPAQPAPRLFDTGRGMPEELATFEQFADRFSLTRDHHVVPALWHQPGFAEKLAARFDAELAHRPFRFSRLWVLAAAGAAAGSHLPSPQDVELLAAWWSGSGVSRIQDMTRTEKIRNAYQEAAIGPTSKWRTVVLLEALSAPGASGLDPALIEEVVHQLELGDHGFEVALTELLLLRTRIQNPIDWLRRVLEPMQEVSVATADERLAKQRRELYDNFRSVHQAGGGKIEQTHCREAWKEFVERVLPELRGLFPVEHGGAPSWDTRQKRAFVDGIERLHAQIADRRGARLKARVRMDRIAQRLAGYARDVNEAMAEVEAARQRHAGKIGDVSVRTEVFQRLKEAATPPGAVGGLREILVRAVFPPIRPEDTTDPLEISVEDLRAAPDLLELLPPLGGTAQAPEPGRAGDILDARAAATLLLAPLEEAPPLESLPELLRATGRHHLLAKVVTLCPEEEQLRIHADQEATIEEIRRRLAELESVRLRLADAASPLSDALTAVKRHVLELLDKPPSRLHLFLAWLTRVLEFGRRQLDVAAQGILADAERLGPSTRELVAPLVREQRLAEALTVLRGGRTPEPRSMRHTRPRWAAESVFKDPVRRLAEPDIASRVSRWLTPVSDLQGERALRTEFAKLILEDLYPKEKDQSCISVRCDDVRRRLDERQLNPCYVPQLQRFGHITIPRLVVRPSESNFHVKAADAAGAYPNDLVILLAPRITAERRDAVLQELRRRSATAAVVDDLDMCRLLNPGGTRSDALLGLLEIALEQQRWTAVSPFGVVEGQHVQLEMYVGRRDEARDLAHTSRYSRLFSGRKLGKSALLRYVEQRYDGRPLPSGKRLRVLYVSAVGIDTDVALVDQIVSCLGSRCGPDPQHAPRQGEESAARLQRVLERHVDKHEDESLLIVLDEADAFVEAELERYQRRPHESCLSWVMSRRIESARDSQGLPRVRFVFTGYRVTNTREGVWFNWSEVLQLVPLPVDEAAELVAAPLARLGIDASDLAAVIAHRCGYQPAVLLCFGERLLARLEQQNPPGTRMHRHVRVTADDVAATFEADAIQDEIRRVTSNNFRDNDVGAVLFGALLSIFLGMGPAAEVDAAEDRLLERLRVLDGSDFSWMAQEGNNLHEQIKSKLRDLVARQLLVERRLPGDRIGYALKFPHHLTVLAPLAREDRIREAIARIRSGAGPAAHHARGLLVRGDFEVVRELTTRSDSMFPIAPVVGHLWTLPPAEMRRILHRGLFDPLELDRSRVFETAAAIQSPLGPLLDDATSLAFHGVRAEWVDGLLGGRPVASSMPLLVGGVDLLRHAVRESRAIESGRIHLQPVGFGRLMRGHLVWWFERARGFNFTQADAIERIATATSGIPLLVSALDHQLKRHDPDGGGLEVTSEILARALEDVRLQLDGIASMLVDGEPETRLSPRELDIVRMLAHAARSSQSGTTSWEDLSEHLWPEYEKSLLPGSPLVNAAPIRLEGLLEDEIALEVLERVGLVPSRPEVAPGLVLDRLGPVRPEDALVKLVAHLS